MPQTRKKTLTSEIITEMCRLHNTGSNPREISDLTGFSQSIITSTLHEAGVEEYGYVANESPRGSRTGVRAGPRSLVPQEDEQKLVDFLVELDTFNLNWRLVKLRHVLMQFATDNDLHDLTRTEVWLRGFMDRHSDKITDLPEVLDSRIVEKKFYEVVEAIMAKMNITGRPECVWNMEHIVCCVKRNRKVFALKSRRNGRAPTEDNSQNVTALCAISACGKNSSPAMFFPGSRVVSAWTSDLPEELKSTVSFLLSTQELSECDIVLQWLREVFSRDVTERPILMFVDNRYGTVDACKLISWAAKERIHLVCVPSECTEIVRPLEIAARWSLKKNWRSQVTKAKLSTQRSPKPSLIVKAFISAYVTAMNEQNLKTCFAASGFFPLDPRAVERALKNEIFVPETEQEPLPSGGTVVTEEYQHAVKTVSDALLLEGHSHHAINKLFKNMGIIARLVKQS